MGLEITVSAIELERRKLTADEVTTMVEAGVLGEDEPLELIDGELIVMVPQGPVHRTLIIELAERFRKTYAADAHVQTQVPVAAGPDSLPEPDVAVVRGTPRDFMSSHPTGRDVILAVEVAVSSHAVDRLKADVYAAASVPEYWLLDVPGRRLEVHRHASPNGYGVRTVLAEDEEITLPRTSASCRVHELLP
jgi:Uma2 family endonuclease